MKSGSFLFGTVVGAALGTALGLMYAPGPGSETRARVSETARAFKEAALEGIRNGAALVFVPISIAISQHQEFDRAAPAAAPDSAGEAGASAQLLGDGEDDPAHEQQ
jgi:hypothetical protein